MTENTYISLFLFWVRNQGLKKCDLPRARKNWRQRWHTSGVHFHGLVITCLFQPPPPKEAGSLGSAKWPATQAWSQLVVQCPAMCHASPETLGRQAHWTSLPRTTWHYYSKAVALSQNNTMHLILKKRKDSRSVWFQENIILTRKWICITSVATRVS